MDNAQREKVLAVTARLRQKATAKEVNPKDLEKLERELLAELDPTVCLALSGLVCAFYFRPDDFRLAGMAESLRCGLPLRMRLEGG